MGEHTKEPWVKTHGHFVEDSNHNHIVCAFSINGIGEETAQANARRIVACVNFCAGVPTEDLEGRNLVAQITEAADLAKDIHDAVAQLQKDLTK